MTIIDSHYRSEMDSFVGVRSDVKLGLEGTGSGEVESCRYLSDHYIIRLKTYIVLGGRIKHSSSSFRRSQGSFRVATKNLILGSRG
jgi:hypothetical protein